MKAVIKKKKDLELDEENEMEEDNGTYNASLPLPK